MGRRSGEEGGEEMVISRRYCLPGFPGPMGESNSETRQIQGITMAERGGIGIATGDSEPYGTLTSYTGRSRRTGNIHVRPLMGT